MRTSVVPLVLHAVPMTVDAATLVTTVAMTSLVDAAPLDPLARLARILAQQVVAWVVARVVALVVERPLLP